MNLTPKKSLGQHFLKSPSVLAKIMDAARLENNETVLEIGPGTGILTDELLKTGAKVVAVEKDDRAYVLLQEKYTSEISSGKLRLVHGDILTINRSEIALEDGKYALVANIPYYITGAILESCLEHEPRPNRGVLLVQKEVAERIVAISGKESILSISVKAFGKPRIITQVPRGAFVPPPTVDSAVLEIADIKGQNGLDVTLFFKIVKTAFSHKRKYAIRNLEILFDKNTLETAWQKAELAPNVRAEDVPVGKWGTLAQLLRVRG